MREAVLVYLYAVLYAANDGGRSSIQPCRLPGREQSRANDLAGVPDEVRALLAPHLAELGREPVPPLRPPPELAGQLAACQAASLVTASETASGPRWFVHRWTATELAGHAANDPGSELAEAHNRAAGYWRWRVEVWPQDRAAYVHDLLEARYHLLQAGNTETAGEVSEWACLQLDGWGAWDQEASVIHDTLAHLPEDSPRRAAWIHQLGILAQKRGDYDEAASQYQRSLAIKERLGDQAGMATSYHQLGMLAHVRGDYDEAARQYQRSLTISERLGDQAGMATSYHQLGILAYDRENYDEAARQYQRSLAIEERLGNQAGMATSYHQLGMLAQRRGDYDEAAGQYRRSLAIEERLGNQAGMATTYHQLGILAHDRGDYDEATRQYRRSLTINERLGNQAGIASTYHQMGILEADRGECAGQAIGWHVRALEIWLRLGIPQAMIDLRQLATFQVELGPERFSGLLARAAGNPQLAEVIMSALGQLSPEDTTGE